MRQPLRVRYFLWLACLVLAYFVAYAVLLFFFNRYESAALGHDAGEEFTEFLVLVGLGAATMPFMLLLAWVFSSRMLKPLQTMADTAQRISAGRLEERVSVPDGRGEMTALAQTLNQAFDRYQNAMERMKDFASNASHQLRTPLTAMRSVGEVALQKARAPEEYRETIGSMLEEVHRLAHVIEQLLLLARMESAELRRHFENTNVVAEMAAVVGMRKPIIESKGIHLDIAPGPAVSIKANPALLRQAFANLLDNAIRHTPEGGRIEIATVLENDEALVRVADTGPGIPEHYRNKLFERFSPGGSSDQHGTGLGLAIVAEVVKVHGGSLQVESVPGKGASFTMRFPG